MKKLSFNIIGAGAMGHLWTSFLNLNRFKATLYSRQEQPGQTFKVKSLLGNFQQQIDYQILHNWKHADIILVTVKAHQLEDLCQQLKQLEIKPCRLILLMNGMGLIKIVKQYLPHVKALHASIIHGVYLQEHTIYHTGKGVTILGNLETGYNPDIFSDLVKQLNTALPLVSWNENHQQAMNLKLLINAIINPLTALANKNNGCVLNHGKLNSAAETLLKELMPLIKMMMPNSGYQPIKSEIERVANATQHNISSMLQDIRANKKTEIDFINGYLVKLAKNSNIELPKHVEIIRKIKQLKNN